MTLSRRHVLRTAAAGSLLAATTPSGTSFAQDQESAAEPAGETLKLLILGGTGILGPWTVRAALARGHSITLFNRGKSNPHLFPELEKLRGDRDTGDLDALEGREFDAVIDTSAYVPGHVEATAAIAAESARQYVIFSSISVYADHGIPNADENTPVAEITDELAETMTTISESLAHYGAMKARCETAAKKAMPGKVTVIRPGLICGPGDYSDRFGYWAVRVARGGEVLAPGDGHDPIQYIDVRDLAEWTIHCLEQQVTGTFNGITPGGRFDMMQMLHGMKASVVTDADFTWVTPEFLEENEVQGWTHLPVWMPAVGETAGFHLASADAAIAAGLRYRPLAHTVADAVAWYTEEKGDDYRFGARAGLTPEREAELLGKWPEAASKKGGSAENR